MKKLKFKKIKNIKKMAAITDKYAKLFHSILHKYINLFSWKNFACFFIFIELYFLNIIEIFNQFVSEKYNTI